MARKPGTSRKHKSTPIGGDPVHGTVSVELPTRRPRHPAEGRAWGFARDPGAAVEAAHELLKARCAMSPVPHKTIAAEGLTSGVSPKVVRADYLAAEWPSDAGSPPEVARRAMPPEMQADAQRILDRLPAYPWSADPAGVYSRSGEYLLDTGGDDALARQVARLPELLDAAVQEAADAAEHVHAIGVGFQDTLAEVKDAERDNARAELLPVAWNAGWSGGYGQAAGRARDAAGDATSVARTVLDSAVRELNRRVTALAAALTLSANVVAPRFRRAPSQHVTFTGARVPAVAPALAGRVWRLWPRPYGRPPCLPAGSTRLGAPGVLARLAEAAEALGIDVDAMLLRTRGALDAVDRAVEAVVTETPTPESPEIP